MMQGVLPGTLTVTGEPSTGAGGPTTPSMVHVVNFLPWAGTTKLELRERARVPKHKQGYGSAGFADRLFMGCESDSI